MVFVLGAVYVLCLAPALAPVLTLPPLPLGGSGRVFTEQLFGTTKKVTWTPRQAAPSITKGDLHPRPSGTLGVHTFKLSLLAALGEREEDLTKVQTGGPDGDLGSNEIKPRARLGDGAFLPPPRP